MTKAPFWLAAAFIVLCVLLTNPRQASARDQGVVATVNDSPITTLDIEQRLQLKKILGEKEASGDARKAALRTMIDEIIKIAEGKKYKVNPSEKEIDSQMARMAKGMKTDAAGLTALLGKNGIAPNSLRQLIAAQISFLRILAGKYQVKVTVDPAEVDKKYAEIKNEMEQKVSTIMNDPRMKPVQVYSLL